MFLEYILYPGMLFCLWLVVSLALIPLKAALSEIRVLVESKADRDRLTGLWNRIALFEALDLVVAKSLEEAISICFIDIDKFKDIIKLHGHDVADATVENVANLIIEHTGRKDFIAKYDREQFVVIYLNCDGITAQGYMESVREAVVLMSDIEFHTVKITVSIGVCDVRGVQERTPKAILQAVEQAAYMAKRSGRNRVFRGDVFLNRLPPPPKWRS
jgi:diguanylate cyclase (GGDEF)-like protein